MIDISKILDQVESKSGVSRTPVALVRNFQAKCYFVFIEATLKYFRPEPFSMSSLMNMIIFT